MTMNAYEAVLLYGGWMLLLTLTYAVPRVPQGLTGAKATNSWERDKPNTDPAIMQRIKHAHLNATESFPVFAAVVVIAGLMSQMDTVNVLAPWVLYARIAQSLLHISGTGFFQVMLRATAFVVQVALIGVMIFSLIS